MTSAALEEAVYWDASAVLSVLFRDEHSETALEHAGLPAVHLLSSLALAEVHAVLARIERERAAATVLVDASREALAQGPWRPLNLLPHRALVSQLARKWPLRGADLWHLSLAKTLQADLPELMLLSFDCRLATAADGEGLAKSR